MKKLLFLAFIVLLFIQWIIPFRMIAANQYILRHGKTIKFKTAPLDPANPFIGNYVLLKFEEESIKTGMSPQWRQGQKVYVSLTEDKDGFGHVSGLSKFGPGNNQLYVKANVYYASQLNDKQEVMLDFPFNKFYMDEYKAPKAERIYNDANIASRKQNVYSLVTILDGDALIRDIIVNDTSIVEVVKNHYWDQKK